jgi:hypothetical protein
LVSVAVPCAIAQGRALAPVVTASSVLAVPNVRATAFAVKPLIAAGIEPEIIDLFGSSSNLVDLMGHTSAVLELVGEV